MSALGHKRTYAVQKGMSALPPKADMCSATRYVRDANSGHLLAGLIRAYSENTSFPFLETKDKSELFDRQILFLR